MALKGVGSLFGFLKVKDMVDKLVPLVSGRILVFFPGSYENNNYRLLDGYDGWNYLAVPMTADNAAAGSRCHYGLFSILPASIREGGKTGISV